MDKANIIKKINNRFHDVKIKNANKTFIGKLLRLEKRKISMCLGNTIYLYSGASERTLLHELVHHEQQRNSNLLYWLYRYFMPQSLIISFALLSVMFAILTVAIYPLLVAAIPLAIFSTSFFGAFIIGLFCPEIVPQKDIFRQKMEAHANAVSLAMYFREIKEENDFSYVLTQYKIAFDRCVDMMQGPIYKTIISRKKTEELLKDACKLFKMKKVSSKEGFSSRLYDIFYG